MRRDTVASLERRLTKLEASKNPEPGPWIIILRPVVDAEGRECSPDAYRCPQLNMTVEREPGEDDDAFFDRAETILKANGGNQTVVQLHPVMPDEEPT